MVITPDTTAPPAGSKILGDGRPQANEPGDAIATTGDALVVAVGVSFVELCPHAVASTAPRTQSAARTRVRGGVILGRPVMAGRVSRHVAPCRWRPAP